jgi:hypothetical protein
MKGSAVVEEEDDILSFDNSFIDYELDDNPCSEFDWKQAAFDVSSLYAPMVRTELSEEELGACVPYYVKATEPIIIPDEVPLAVEVTVNVEFEKTEPFVDFKDIIIPESFDETVVLPRPRTKLTRFKGKKTIIRKKVPLTKVRRAYKVMADDKRNVDYHNRSCPRIVKHKVRWEAVEDAIQDVMDYPPEILVELVDPP